MAENLPPPWWKAPWKFFIESIVGIFIFGVIGAGAVSIKFIVDFLSTKGVDSYILLGLKGAEYALFTTDMVLFGRFLWKTGQRIWKEF